MGRIVPDGFLTISQALDRLVAGMYSGVPDRPVVKDLKARGSDVADGFARDAANERLWDAVDRGRVEVFLVGPKQPSPFKISPDMTREIPLLRSSRGGDFTFLRPSKGRVHRQLTEWFGPDLSLVSVVCRERSIERLARTRLQARRRKAATVKMRGVGRPSVQDEVKRPIREIVDKGRWSTQESKKALTFLVNRCRPERASVSQSTVSRALDELYQETNDRRFQCLPRKGPQL
jgi:polyhydroxyalkanoate synthesis regulator phasin